MGIEDEALRAINPDTLLPGEAESTDQPEDARHWVAVYSELISTKQKLLANLREMMERQPDQVRDELERADVSVIEAQIDRFQRRFEYWQRRISS